MRAVSIIIWSFIFLTARNEEPCDEVKWCSLMNKYYQTLSVLDDRQFSSKWGSVETEITSTNFGQFLKEMKDVMHDEENASSCSSTNASKKQINEVNEILELTPKLSEKNLNCYENRIVVRRNFLRISHVNQLLESKLQDPCYKEAKMVELYAADTIVFDSSLILSRMSLVIAAPIWDVRLLTENGSIIAPIINLIGSRMRVKRQANSSNGFEKAKEILEFARFVAKSGRDGKPGKPGDSAGNFLGIGLNFKNMDHLNIIVNGADGMDGEDGENGENGLDALAINNVYCGIEGADKRSNSQDPNYRPFYCEGMKGKEGGNGGRGGYGGKGGYAGKVEIIRLSDSFNSPIINASDGKLGNHGKPGRGGKGGENGRSLYCRYNTEYDETPICEVLEALNPSYPTTFWDRLTHGPPEFFWAAICKCTSIEELTKIYPVYPDGKFFSEDGNITLDKNEEGRQDPTPAVEISTAHVLSTFKDVMRKTLFTAYTHKRYYAFLLQLYRNDTLMNKYSILQLIQEFIALENDYYNLYEKVDLSPIYEAFQAHVFKRFSNEPKNVSHISESGVVLFHLYTTLQSKICSFQDAAKSTFISDTSNFLDVFMENVHLLKEKNAYQAVLNIGEQYSKEMDTNIEEGTSTINTFIIPKINNLTNKIDKCINNLIMEMEMKLAALKDEKKKLEEKANQLKIAQGLAIFSGVLKLASIVTMAIPVVGPAVSVTLNVAGVAIDTFNKGPSYQRSEDSIEFTKDAIKMGQGILKQINDTFGEDDKPQAGGTNKKNNEAWKKGMKQAAGVIIDTAETTVKIIEETKATNAEIKNNLEAQKALKKTITNVKQELSPTIKQFQGIMLGVIESAQNKSSAELSVAKMEMDTFVRELMQVLQSLAKHFPSGGEIMKAMEGLMAAFNTVMEINNQNLGFIQNKKMGKLITVAGSARFQSISEIDPKYQIALNKLEKVLYTNIILIDYKQSIEELRQFVFPLARAFMGKMNMKSFLKKIHNNTDDILEFAIREIEFYKMQLARTKAFIMNYDDIRYRTTFDAGMPTKSFFVWKYEDKNERERIDKLFNGTEVSFEATTKFHRDKYSVKFNTIGITFKLKSAIYSLYEEQLYYFLRQFKMIMIHSGDNAYICDNKTYHITTKKLKFEYSFHNFGRNKPIFRNTVYEKLAGGDFKLSPFTVWKFQLVNISSDGRYELLKKFKERIEVHLAGDGEYYASNSQVCGKDLEEYYPALISTQEKQCVYDDEF